MGDNVFHGPVLAVRLIEVDAAITTDEMHTLCTTLDWTFYFFMEALGHEVSRMPGRNR